MPEPPPNSSPAPFPKPPGKTPIIGFKPVAPKLSPKIKKDTDFEHPELSLPIKAPTIPPVEAQKTSPKPRIPVKAAPKLAAKLAPVEEPKAKFQPSFKRPAPNLTPQVEAESTTLPTSISVPGKLKPKALVPPPADDMQELFKEEFESYVPEIVEAFDHLNKDLALTDAWQALKTKFHAIKGAANTVKLPDLGTLAHGAEKAALDALEFEEHQTTENFNKAAETFNTLASKLKVKIHQILPLFPSVKTKPSQTKSSIKSSNTKSSAILSSTEISAPIVALQNWQASPSEESKATFLNKVESLLKTLQGTRLTGLQNSFSQLEEFTHKVPQAPQEIFFSVMHRALDDVRIYLNALKHDPTLPWSRKWGFYFASMEIALASEIQSSSNTDSSEPANENRDPDMVEAFLEEAADNLQQIEQSLIAWEQNQNPSDQQANLRRHFHTLKGAANSVGLTKLGGDFHILEDTMDKHDPNEPVEALLPRLFGCLDEASQYVDLLKANPQAPWPGNWGKKLTQLEEVEESNTSESPRLSEPIDPEMMDVFIEEAENLFDPIETAIMQWENGQDEKSQQQALRRNFHTLKGAANSIGLAKLGNDFHALEDFMEQGEVETESGSLFSFLLGCLDDIRNYISKVQSDPLADWPQNWAQSIENLQQGIIDTPKTDLPKEDTELTSPKTPPPERQTLRVEASQLQELMHMISELVAEQTKIQEYVSQLKFVQNQLIEIANETISSEATIALKEKAEQIGLLHTSLGDDDQLFRRYAKRIQSDLVELNM
ncbi:MAG: Hpt domain-containing protein, partial [Verrucomicrobiota bacterium]